MSATFNLTASDGTDSPLRRRIAAARGADEAAAVAALLDEATLTPQALAATQRLAATLAQGVRTARTTAGGVDALMLEFSLDSREGVALMCLAEALLRIPDPATRDRLIRDKIGGGDWRAHIGRSPSLFVNAAAWGLLVTGQLVDSRSDSALEAALTSLLRKGGEPLIRKGVDLAMRLLGKQFVTGRTIVEAIANAREREARGYRYSYDMLGEAALTAEAAQRYLTAYEQAIDAIGEASAGAGVYAGPGVSIKLSALHPRFSRLQRERVLGELLPRVAGLALRARSRDIGFSIDAEEADRLELSLDLFERLAADPALSGWDGLGFVVQTYQTRGRAVIDWLVDVARRYAAPLDDPSGQGSLLGQRDQARAGGWAGELSGVHAQGAYRRVLPGLRQGDAGGPGCDLPAVRQPQCVHHCRGLHARRHRRLRVPVPARHGRGGL